MTIEAPQIWKELIKSTKYGGLEWRDPSMNSFSSLEPDTRMYPEKYIAMSGNQRFWDSGDINKFNNSDLVLDRTVDDIQYSAPNGVVTGVLGLLKTIELFKEKSVNPAEVLLVGSITEKSLMCTLEFAKIKCWSAHTLLVDNSSVPLGHIEELKKHGQFKGSPDFDLLNADVLRVNPQIKPDVIISDLCNIWTIPKFSLSNNETYTEFKHLLHWAKSSLSVNGVFYSRCVVYPETCSNLDLNVRHQSKYEAMADDVVLQLGSIADGVDPEWLLESISSLFESSYPASYCGLGGSCAEFTEHPTLEGKEAEVKMIQFHRQIFANVEIIKIKDLKTNAIYLNLACKN